MRTRPAARGDRFARPCLSVVAVGNGSVTMDGGRDRALYDQVAFR